MKWKLVYFDDQVQNIECFVELLEDHFEVIGCNDATAYSTVLEHHHPHAFLLDVHMPVLDGHMLYKKITEHPLYNGCPIIFISGDHSDENIIRSYENGAIDFLSRNLKSEEIIARLSNKIKFYLQMSTKLELGNLSMDVETFEATIAHQHVDLTMLEMRILSNLLRVYPQALTRADLIMRLKGEDSVKPGTINTHLTNLRPKIENWDHMIKIREENILILKKNQ